MGPEFTLPDIGKFTIGYALPAEYRGRVLRGASVVTAIGESGSIIIQTYEQPLYTIRFKELSFLQNVNLLFTQKAARVFSFLALKSNIHYHLQGIGVLRLKEGQCSALQTAHPEFSAVYEKDQTYQSFEIDWAEDIVRESIDAFPNLDTLLTQRNFSPSFIGNPSAAAGADLLGLTHDILHPPYATAITGQMFDHKIREYYLIVMVAVGKVPVSKLNITPDQLILVDKITKMLRDQKDKRYTIAQLAEMATMNTMKFKEAFKERNNLPPFEYQMAQRMQEARAILEEGRMTIQEVARYIGYKGASSFSTKFREHFGFPPSKITKIK